MGGPAPLLLVSDRELGAMLSISRTTVWNLVQRGVLPPPVKLGGSTRWSVQEVEAAISRPLRAQPDELSAERTDYARKLGRKGQAAKQRRRRESK